MRLLHTADWHLGRLFHGIHLTEDQGHVLDQVVGIAKDSRVDAVVIAGDIYDRAVPPPEAVRLLDDVLARLVLGVEVPVVLIAGNHDSPQRLGFCSRLLARNGLHVFGCLGGEVGAVTLEDKWGPVRLYALPYTEPPVVREVLGADVADHNDAMRALAECVRAIHPRKERSVLVCHAYVVGCEASESERPLSVGGAGTVESACFDGFHYVALGHLHRRQAVGAAERVRYSGSLMKYSFAEAEHVKSVEVVELDRKGQCRTESIPLMPRRDMRCVEGCLEDLLERPLDNFSRDDYLQVTLLDKGPLLDAMGRLREVYPNVLHIERPALDPAGELAGNGTDSRKMDLADLFKKFFAEMTGDELTPAQHEAFIGVAEAARRREREGVA
jgi:exonuclease SbcD